MDYKYLAKPIKAPDHQHRPTLEWVLFELTRNGHIAAAIDLMLHPESNAKHCLVWNMKPSSWSSGEFESGGHGDSITYSKGSPSPEGYAFDHPVWETLFEFLPDELVEWVAEYFAERGP